MDQTCFGLSGSFAPTILPLFHGTYLETTVLVVLKTSVMATSFVDEVDYYDRLVFQRSRLYETRLCASIRPRWRYPGLSPLGAQSVLWITLAMPA